MDGQVILSIVLVILGGGLVSSLAQLRAGLKREPIEARTAAVANAETAGTIALELANQLNDRLGVVEARAERAEATARRAMAVVRIAVDHIGVLEQWINERRDPPPPPRPGGLSSLESLDQ